MAKSAYVLGVAMHGTRSSDRSWIRPPFAQDTCRRLCEQTDAITADAGIPHLLRLDEVGHWVDIGRSAVTGKR